MFAIVKINEKNKTVITNALNELHRLPWKACGFVNQLLCDIVLHNYCTAYNYVLHGNDVVRRLIMGYFFLFKTVRKPLIFHYTPDRFINRISAQSQEKRRRHFPPNGRKGNNTIIRIMLIIIYKHGFIVKKKLIFLLYFLILMLLNYSCTYIHINK